jgi:hypothetical protein
MKTYIAILIGIVVLFSVVFVGYKFTNKDGADQTAEQQLEIRTAKISGEVTRNFEGDHTLAYAFDIPEVASTTVDMDGALVKVVGATGTEATVYYSYEGARGYSAVDYISEVVALHVPVIDVTGTTTVGGYEWTMAETAGSEWYLTHTADKQWLIVVEARKSLHDNTLILLSSMDVK